MFFFALVILMGTSALATTHHNKKLNMKKVHHKQLAPEGADTETNDETVNPKLVQNQELTEEDASNETKLFLPTIVGTLAPKMEADPVPTTELNVAPKILSGAIDGAVAMPVEEEQAVAEEQTQEEECDDEEEEASNKVQATVVGEENETDQEYVSPQMKGEEAAEEAALEAEEEAYKPYGSSTSSRLHKMLGDIRESHEQVKTNHEQISDQLEQLESQLKDMDGRVGDMAGEGSEDGSNSEGDIFDAVLGDGQAEPEQYDGEEETMTMTTQTEMAAEQSTEMSAEDIAEQAAMEEVLKAQGM